MKNTGILVLTFLMFSGCELVVDVEVPFVQPQLTLNSVINPDSLWKARVTRNRHVLDEQPFEEINNAQVIVYENGAPIDTLTSIGSGFYLSDNKKPETGKDYSIMVAASNYKSVSAHTSIPPKTVLAGVEIGETQQGEWEETTDVRIRFTDDGALNNYYQLVVEIEQENYDYVNEIIHTYRNSFHVSSDDPLIQNDNDELNAMIFKDILFNGNDVDLKFKIHGPRSSGSLRVVLKSLSEGYYNYLNTSSLQEFTSGDPFAQPVNVFNNIENGFGIFSGYNASLHEDARPRPVIVSITPSSAKRGERITITGENFGDEYIRVAFKAANYTTFTQAFRTGINQFEVTVPHDAITGKIVMQGTFVTISDEEFVVLD